MNTAAHNEPRIKTLQITNDSIVAHLVDGRIISVPLAWSWRLSEATDQERKDFEILGSGQGVHWPQIDEDISAWGMLHGIPAHRPQASKKTKKFAPRAKRAKAA
jgi:hypothetical protein